MTSLRQTAGVFAFSVAVAAGLAGCADRPNPIPSSANLMSEGNNGVVTFSPVQHGRVYVSDKTDNRILYQAEIDRGERVEVDPRADHITVGGRTVYDRTMDDGHQYRIFFEETPRERSARYRDDSSGR